MKSLIFIGNSRKATSDYYLVQADNGTPFYVRSHIHEGDLASALDAAGSLLWHPGDVVMNTHPTDTQL